MNLKNTSSWLGLCKGCRVITANKRHLGQSNVFRNVCLSTWGCLPLGREDGGVVECIHTPLDTHTHTHTHTYPSGHPPMVNKRAVRILLESLFDHVFGGRSRICQSQRAKTTKRAWWGGRQPIIPPNFPGNCMKRRKLARKCLKCVYLDPPLPTQSTVGKSTQFRQISLFILDSTQEIYISSNSQETSLQMYTPIFSLEIRMVEILTDLNWK